MINRFVFLVTVSSGLMLFGCDSGNTGNETIDSEQVNLKPFNAPDQKKFAIAWLEIRDQYQKTENPIKKKNLVNRLKTLFENKKFKNWIGQIKQITAINSYVQVQINQMFSYNDKTDMVYYLDISKESDLYNYLVNLEKGDTVRFSGKIEKEFSLTNNGMVTEPMLSVICSELDGHKNSDFYLDDVPSLNDKNGILKFIQGKWSMMVPSSGTFFYYRFEINGSKIKTWARYEGEWGSPDFEGEFMISDIQYDYDGEYRELTVEEEENTSSEYGLGLRFRDGCLSFSQGCLTRGFN
jgi:hypothetical protein